MHQMPAMVLIMCFIAPEVVAESPVLTDMQPAGRGPYLVGSTNMEVAPEYADIGDDAMHNVLLGRTEESDDSTFVSDVLRYPESAWIVDVPIPDESEIYGPASGQTLPVSVFLTYPSSNRQAKNAYSFPYHDAEYGVFEDMLGADELPSFADPDERYPLVILSHGASAHGIFDVGHAHLLASHGFVVAVLTYGDDRTAIPDDPSHHLGFLRPLLTKAVLDSILASEAFGANIDSDNIGISGHSFGGFTALALAGGQIQGNAATVSDKRIKAGVIAAPWVGGPYEDSDYFAFGPNNNGLDGVTAATICFYGTKDEVTLASFILPAMKRLSGPTYVVELLDQPHVFEGGSWEDRNAWELLFLSAYLKNDTVSLSALKTGRSMTGGNEDYQRFEYQKLTATD